MIAEASSDPLTVLLWVLVIAVVAVVLLAVIRRL